MTSVEQASDGFEERLRRYLVGIDLGTTNTAVASLDTEAPHPTIENFQIDQWVDFGVSEKRRLLPSFHYQPLVEEAESLSQAARKDPSVDASNVVGTLARDRGLQLPGRQIGSAKSWLCHAGVDRLSPILPWQSDEGVEKQSPVDASARYLSQIRRAWDRAHRKHPLAEQDIVLTLPASFDQVARQLTIVAAKQAGLPRVLLIEEPQAAFYAWLSRNHATWETQVRPGQTILVCDIGGGTTDFTLIRVHASVRNADTLHPEIEQAAHATSSESKSGDADATSINPLNRGRLSLHRVAVGQHLILGGDNIDLALARHSEQKLTGGKSLAVRSWDALRQACRVAKEELLGESAPASHTIYLPGSGSRLIGGGSQVEITTAEVEACVLDGFFPKCGLKDRPQIEQVGFQEFGLPYAQDARITRHLAAFLWDHRHDGRSDEELSTTDELRLARPDWVLFNGGVLTSSRIVERLLDVVGSWFASVADGQPADSPASGGQSVSDEPSTQIGWRPGVLDGEALDLAVAIGAAYFGNVRRGVGVEIEAQLACSYYLQTNTSPPEAICIVPGSASPGDKFRLSDLALELTIGRPVQFPVVYSRSRLADRVGQRVHIDMEHFASLPPIRTVIDIAGRKQRGMLPVVIDIELSQIGTLQMWCQSKHSEQRWKLEFDVRGSTQSDAELRELTANQAGIVDEQMEIAARQVIEQTFGTGAELPPSKLMRALGDALELGRSEWPPGLLRAMWQALMDCNDGRKKSPSHEARWLNLLGYALRPGYGLAADDWRVAQSWRAVHGKLNFAVPSSRNESLILWRRIAGGFTAGQQLTIYQQIAGPFRNVLDPSKRAKGGVGTTPHELIELLRLVGSLELLPKFDKHVIGDWLLQLLGVSKWVACQPAVLWTLARLGARVPAYGPLNSVVDVEIVSTWVQRLLDARQIEDGSYALVLMSCARRVGDRYRDIGEDLRANVIAELQSRSASDHYIKLVTEGGQLAGEEAEQILGESLPLGLQIAGQPAA